MRDAEIKDQHRWSDSKKESKTFSSSKDDGKGAQFYCSLHLESLSPSSDK